jgi:hypothetical protein
LSIEHKTSLASAARKNCPCQGLSVIESSSRVQAFVDASSCDFYS